VRVENGKNESREEKDRCQPARDLCQHVGRLGAENVLGYATAKGRTEAFAFWALHQDHEHHQECDDDVKPEQNIDQQGHLGRAI